ncbi:GumM protein [Sulfuriferula plumbiphila]|uniref:GumM protein n=1 Tax=Sulfuriferula plumbiphila TaxID=171865 RepID=A0A512L6B9_9PROT|nr:WecB/TagA/CpsF family glycosyltransferase [Sulfuriferula plumbiphila]BBP03618.1 GumM protein [Sulfuriferula plumbiphila]GEP30019.1 GumM protein [Sulfuriferula plumbiphila]
MHFDKVIRVGDFPVLQTTSRELAMHLLDSLQRKRRLMLFFANTNFVVKCRGLSARMCKESVLIVNDGVGMDIAAWLIHRSRFKENLNGTDFTPYLFSQSGKPLRIFMLGGKPAVLQKAADHLARRLGQEVVGVRDGYQGINDPHLLEIINAASPDVILVALGNPLQEEWILNSREALDAGVIIGVGALFDFWAGDKPRAPVFVQKVRLEWFYRLLLEPRRLLRRYTVDIVRFLFHCYKCRERRPG